MFQAPNLNRREPSDRRYIEANPSTFTATGSDNMRERMHGATTAFHIFTQDAAFSSEPTDATLEAHIIGTQGPARLTGNSGSIASGNTP